MAFDSGNGYIISKSLKKSLQEDRKWAIDQTGYTVADKNFKYKSRIITVIVKDQEGNKRLLKQKAVVYWSKHFYNREIIDKYHGLSRIENQFEELKEPLETRPVYVKTKERIHAHLLLCVIFEEAAQRLLECILDNEKGCDTIFSGVEQRLSDGRLTEPSDRKTTDSEEAERFKIE